MRDTPCGSSSDHVPHDPALAGGIHALQDQQDGFRAAEPGLGEEPFLQCGELGRSSEQRLAVGLAAGVARGASRVQASSSKPVPTRSSLDGVPRKHRSICLVNPLSASAAAARGGKSPTRAADLRLSSPVPAQEFLDPVDGFFDVHVRQRDQTEVVGPDPVERPAVRDQDLLLAEQVQDELLVVADRIDLGVQLREQVDAPRGPAGC